MLVALNDKYIPDLFGGVSSQDKEEGRETASLTSSPSPTPPGDLVQPRDHLEQLYGV